MLKSSQEPGVVYDQLEPIYQVKYTVTDLPTRKSSNMVFEKLKANSLLPINGVFVPKATWMKGRQSPFKIFGGGKWVMEEVDPNLKFVFDSTFQVNKLSMKMVLLSSKPKTWLQVYSNCLTQMLKPLIDDATQLRASLQIVPLDTRVEIWISGYTDVVSTLLKKTAAAIRDQKITTEMFEAAKSSNLQRLSNLEEDVGTALNVFVDPIFSKGAVSVEEMRNQLTALTLADISGYATLFWALGSYEWLVVGNIDQSSTVAMVRDFLAQVNGGMVCNKNFLFEFPTLQIPAKPLPNPRTSKNVVACTPILQTLLSSPFIELTDTRLHLQIGPYAETLFYTMKILKTMVFQPFFNRIRTEQQLGYKVEVVLSKRRTMLELLFEVVSSEKNVTLLTDSVVAAVLEVLVPPTEQQLNVLKQAVKSEVSAPPNSVDMLFSFVETEFSQRTFYVRRQEPADVQFWLDRITVSSVTNVINQLLTRRLIVRALPSSAFKP